jgi:hypothetical protein
MTEPKPTDLHYWGYAGKPTFGIPCGAPSNNHSKVTGYANDVTCPGCRAALDASFASTVTRPR